MKALPAWFPGMGWKSEAAECRRCVSDGLNTPYEWAKRCIVRPEINVRVCVANGECKEQGSNAAPSMVADAITRYRLEDDSNDPELVQAIKESAGTLYGGDCCFKTCTRFTP